MRALAAIQHIEAPRPQLVGALVPGGRSIDAVGDGERTRKSDPRRDHAPTGRFVTLHLLRDGDIVRI